MTREALLEQRYMDGSRAAVQAMLEHCLRRLAIDASEPAREAWVAERAEAVAALRRICTTHGDLDWAPTLHLGDVIEKHLERHLEPFKLCAGCSQALSAATSGESEAEHLSRMLAMERLLNEHPGLVGDEALRRLQA